MIVDHDVETAIKTYRLGYHRVTFRRIAYVDDEHFARAAKFADFVTHGFKMCGIAAGDQDRRAPDCEFAGDRDTYSSAASGYDGDLTLDAEYIFQSGNPPAFFSDLACAPVLGNSLARPALSPDQDGRTVTAAL
jgi:hypothetical protein